jgi:hypothetical protein
MMLKGTHRVMADLYLVLLAGTDPDPIRQGSADPTYLITALSTT